MIKFNDLSRQQIKIYSNIHKRISNVLKHGKYIMGPEISELENKLSNFVNSKYCISVSSGTDALLISLMALNIKKDDEIITSPFSYFATTEIILMLGAKPIYVDIDPLTFNIDVNQVENKISKKTKAIMPVSIFGQCAELSKLEKIAKKYKIYLIEDAAQSFGATHNSKKSCNFGDIGCTSFFPSKPLGCYGDGGACFTNNLSLAKKIKKIRVHGQYKANHHSIIGTNARLDTIQAAILLEKFKLFEKEIKLRKKIASNYNKLILENCSHIKIPLILNNNESVYAQYTVLVKNRSQIISNFNKHNIPYSIYYPLPAYKQKIFLNKKTTKLKNVEKITKEVFSIPMHPYLNYKEQSKIVKLLK
jgi:UDP-2-acetamido-2-deoxy-ribo-hexuluronate aminotransferase